MDDEGLVCFESFAAGVDHLILAVAYQPDALMEALRGLDCSKEDEPLGTAGPIRLAKPLLLGDVEPSPAAAAAAAPKAAAASAVGFAKSIPEEKDCFFVCNSDVICSFPLEAMWAFHKQKGAEATILVTTAKDPSKFGVVLHEEDGCVVRFVEKPSTFVGNWINAGQGPSLCVSLSLLVRLSVSLPLVVCVSVSLPLVVCVSVSLSLLLKALPACWVYILNKKCIDRIPLARCSIEKEFFPQLAAEGRLFCFHLQGYWADIGQPKDFLEGMSLYLQDLRVHREGGPQSAGDPLTGGLPDAAAGPPVGAPQNASPRGDEFTLVSMPSQEMGLVEGPNIIGNVLVDPSATIGEGSVLGPNVSVDSGVSIGRGCRLKNCAIMRGVRVSDFAWIDSSIVGWQSSIGKWVRVEGLTVVGENVHIEDECLINGAFILPHKTISHSVSESGTIIM
ncbi:hypothetical protein Esti_003879 [Eimeria stiedai]